MNIEPAGRLRDFLQPLFVQLRFHHLSVAVLHKSRRAALASDWNQRAFRCPDADRENPHAGISRGLRRLRRIAAQLFAIGKNNERAIADRALPVSLDCEIDRRRNIRASFWNRVRVEIVDRFHRRVVIDRQRRLEERAAGKCDQPHAISLQLVEQILRGKFHPLKPARRHVVRKHAARSIRRKNQVESFSFHVLISVTPARFGQRHDRQANAQECQREPELAPAPVDCPREIRQQSIRDKRAQPCHRPFFRASE